ISSPHAEAQQGRSMEAPPSPRGTRRVAPRQRPRVLLPHTGEATMTPRPIDADNHYYESLDAFTRQLPREFKRRGVRPVQDGKRVELLIGGRVNRFIPNPTFDPIIVPGCLDPLFRGQIPEGVHPASLMKVEPLRI